MKLYTASCVANFRRVKCFNEDARAAGHVITHDWTHTTDGDSAREAHVAPHVAREWAQHDLWNGVAQAHTVVFFAMGEGFCGSLIEFGYGLARSVPIWVVEPWRASIFWHLQGVTVIESEAVAREALGMRALR